jgi:hypothetical protein
LPGLLPRGNDRFRVERQTAAHLLRAWQYRLACVISRAGNFAGGVDYLMSSDQYRNAW